MTTVLLSGEDKVTVVTEDGKLVFNQISEQRMILAVGPNDPMPPPPPPIPPSLGENWLVNGNLMDQDSNASFAGWFQKHGYFFNTSIQPKAGGLHRPIPDWALVGVVAWGLQWGWDYVDGVPSRRNTFPQPVNAGDMVYDEAWTIVDNPPPHEEFIEVGWAEGHHLEDTGINEGVAILRVDAMMHGDEDWENLFEHRGCQSPVGTGHPNPATVEPDLPALYNFKIPLGEHGPWDKYRVHVTGGLIGKNAEAVWAGFKFTGA